MKLATAGLVRSLVLTPTLNTDAERQRICEVLGELAGTTVQKDVLDLVRQSLPQLARFYNARFAFLGLLVEGQTRRINTMAVWAGTEFADNFSYDLNGTPCGDVMCFNIELVPSGARKLYPTDELLTQMGIDSYFGAPLINTDGEVFGILSVMDVEPMQLNEWTAPILGTFAARVGAEIGRHQAQQELLALNLSLERQVEARTAELGRLNRELDEFSSAVSHDLRAPLRAMSGFSRALREDYAQELPSEACDYLGRIDDASARMSRLIRDLLKLSKTSRDDLEVGDLDLVRLIRDAEQRARADFPEHDVEFRCPDRLPATGDARLLAATLSNLMHNAWKFTQREKTPLVEFGVGEHEGSTMYWIRDNGAGFDPRYEDKLFVPFGRLHADDDFQGTGIGLVTAFRVLERHGGRLWAESKLGEGATFFFTLGP